MDTMRVRLAMAAKLAQSDITEAPPSPDDVANQSKNSWGIVTPLKPHQAEGVSWLIKCYLRGINVILGDEMGLGKTIQAITLISYLKFQRGVPGPFLVLCPLSVIDGWSSELSNHSPKLRVLRYIGSRDERITISREVCQHIDSQPVMSQDTPSSPFDVLVTTFDLAIADVSFLSCFRWRYCIIDEAQRLKNASGVLYKTLENDYMIPRRLLMTGTPVQNNLSELWALLHFCMPLVFNNLDAFLSTFPFSTSHGPCKETNDDLKLLRNILNAFMLRRTKATLVKNHVLILPPLTEVTIFARMVPLQKDVYLSLLKKELPKLTLKSGMPSQMSLQNIVMQLRKACSHPYLFDGVEPEPFEEGEHLVQASGKLLVLDSLLDRLYLEKHRVLIYAQMTRTLDILQDYLDFRGYLYERLDGSVRAEERFAAARKFNAGNIEGSGSVSEPFVFLLTTRAGGVGLNLTAADTVIFYEQDWNPQADKQAVQRAHRIGQNNPVLAVNIVAESTIDEVILSRAKKKLQLTHDIIGNVNADPDADELQSAKLTDLQSMIVFGLDKLHSSNPPDEGDLMPDISKVVQEALKQRNKQDSAALKSKISSSDEELQENIYTFEGQDFSCKKRKREGDESDADNQAVLQSWIDKLRDISDDGSKTVYGRKRPLDRKVESSEQYDALKKDKAEQKKLAKWESLGYKSLAVQDSDNPDDSMTRDDRRGNINFVFGDCTKPRIANNESAIIFSITDDSGAWGSGGMFSALDRLSSVIRERYEAAYEAQDLHVGDLHLIPVDGQLDSQPEQKVYVALGVVQTYNSRRKIPRSEILLPALETCVRKATLSAASMSASIHMPRISSHPEQDRKEWYAIERLLRKYAGAYGVEIFIYYYNRSKQNID